MFANAAIPPEGRRQYFTFATVVTVINSVVGASPVAIATAAIAGAPLGIAAGIGGAVGLLSLALLLRHADRLLEERRPHRSAVPVPVSLSYFVSSQRPPILVSGCLS